MCSNGHPNDEIKMKSTFYFQVTLRSNQSDDAIVLNKVTVWDENAHMLLQTTAEKFHKMNPLDREEVLATLVESKFYLSIRASLRDSYVNYQIESVEHERKKEVSESKVEKNSEFESDKTS